MNGNQQLHTNIKEQQKKHRLINHEIDEHLNLAKGTYSTKMTRLKSGSTHSITVSDFTGLMVLFKCTCMTLFKDVDFTRSR